MNVLMTAHRYWPSVGGTEAFVQSLAETLVGRGHRVTVATSSEPNTPAEEQRNGVTIRRFELLRRGKFRFPGKDYQAFLRRPDWDVVHIHGQRVWNADYAYRFIREKPDRVLFMAHGFHQYHINKFRPPEWAYYYGLLPWGVKRAARIVAETTKEKDELVRFGVDADKISVIPSTLDVQAYQQDLPAGESFREAYGIGEKPFLLYVGGYYENKRVEALVTLSAKTKLPLVVVGRDPDPAGRNQAACAALAAQLDAPVKFVGKIPRADLLRAYREAFLFVMASRFEGYGLVFLEAMASGLPFVSTDCGAANDLARLGCGRVTTIEEMPSVVEAFLQWPERHEMMRRACLTHAAEFNLDRVAAQHEMLYAQIVEQRRAKSPHAASKVVVIR